MGFAAWMLSVIVGELRHGPKHDRGMIFQETDHLWSGVDERLCKLGLDQAVRQRLQIGQSFVAAVRHT